MKKISKSTTNKGKVYSKIQYFFWLLSKVYSKIRYFFWLLSGAEINILKDCPTDYIRQASIGLTVFMTTLIAFFSGAYAGFYFGQSYIAAIVFGLLWSALIFSIDRSMIVTLKKDPTSKSKNFWTTFSSRFVLSVLIAFIISIPLELLIFKDNIEIHKEKFKQDKTLNIKYGQNSIEDIDAKKETSTNLDTNINDVNTLLSKGEPQNDTEYENLKKEVQSLEREYIGLKNKYNSLNSQAINAYNNGNKERYQQISSQRAVTKKNMIAYGNSTFLPKKKEIEVYIKDWFAATKKELSDLGIEKKKVNEKIKKGNEKIENAVSKSDSILSKHDNSFVFNFMVLEDLATTSRKVLKPIKTNNKSKVEESKKEWVEEYDREGEKILLLLWLIRTIFILIEILPTIVKIITPIGAYDRAIYSKEKELELELAERLNESLRHKEKLREMEFEAEQVQAKERIEIENKLHKELITQIAEVQNEVAKKKIEEFRKSHS